MSEKGYFTIGGNTRGEVTPDADAVPERVADDSRVAVRSLPFLNVPGSAKDYVDVVVSYVQGYPYFFVLVHSICFIL